MIFTHPLSSNSLLHSSNKKLRRKREKSTWMRAMGSARVSALLFICMLFISSLTPILGCDCPPGNKPPHKKPKAPKKKTPSYKPPSHVKPPKIKPPVTLPPVVNPPVTIPPVVKPPITLPPVVGPPVTVPPVVNPPYVKPPKTVVPCPPPPMKPATCPIDTLKLGACVDLLGGLVHIGLGDPAINECCPVLQGLVELEAAVCLCTTLKIKLLNLNIFVPLALQLLATCGKTPPPGYTCSI